MIELDTDGANLMIIIVLFADPDVDPQAKRLHRHIEATRSTPSIVTRSAVDKAEANSGQGNAKKNNPRELTKQTLAQVGLVERRCTMQTLA